MQNAYPHFPTRNVQLLDGIWDFAFLGKDGDPREVNIDSIEFRERAPVPGCFDTLPLYAGVRGTAAYRTRLTTPVGKAGRLVFYGLGMWTRIFVDGCLIAETAMPYSKIDVDVPPAETSERTLILLCDNRFDKDRVPLQEQFFDFYAYGGIFRSVEWQDLPACRIERAEVTVVDPAAGSVRVAVRLSGAVPKQIDLSVRFDSAPVQEFCAQTVLENTVELALQVPNPQMWSPQHPHLHILHICSADDAISERFGLRTITTTEHAVCINGSPLKLLGYCRHEAHPQYGPALPLQQLVADLEYLRDLGCNFIRGSHYPQDPRFLDLCDEMGFVVFEESLGWGQKPAHFTNPIFKEAQVRQTEAMVRKSFNHPCVCFWGFLNEGASNTPESRDIYARLASCIRALDSSRLVTYATMHPFDDMNLDLVDVVSANTYPGWYASNRETVAPVDEVIPRLEAIAASLQERGLAGKPLLITEIGAGAIYGWRDPLQAHWSEEYQARFLEHVCCEVKYNDTIAGVALWQFCDCRTYASAMALGRPRGFNNKGTLDEYRRPKLAYEAVRNIFQEGENPASR